ncbi:MAG: hypothetical protein U1D30_04385 [Planctomycetota bacterium]
MKWNCAFRIGSAKGIEPGQYPFRLFVAVGSLADVENALRELVREFTARKKHPSP